MDILLRGPNWIGDTVFAKVVADHLVRRLPGSRVHVWCRAHLVPLYGLGARTGPGSAGLPCYPLPEGRGACSVVVAAAAMKRIRPRAALLLAPSFRAALEARLAAVPIRVGFPDDNRGGLLTHATRRPAARRSRFSPPFARHVLDEWLTLADTLVDALADAVPGTAGTGGTRQPPERSAARTTPVPGPTRHGDRGVFEPAAAFRRALALPAGLARLGHALRDTCRSDSGRPLVGLAPFVGSGRTRAWPIANFQALATRLRRDHGADVVVIGGPGDAFREDGDPGQAVRSTRRGRLSLFLGSTHLPLDMAAALIAALDLLVTNDSGLMHLATALGTPLVGLFGPTLPSLTGPYLPEARDGSMHLLLGRKDLACRGCYLRRCPSRCECLAGIPVDQVAAAVSRRLDEIICHRSHATAAPRGGQ